MSDLDFAVLNFKAAANRSGLVQQRTYSEQESVNKDKWERATRNPKSLSNKNSHLFGDYRKFK